MKYGNYGRKRKFDLLRSPFTLIALFILFVVLAKATWSIHQKAVISENRLEQAQTALNKLAVRQKDLQSQVSYLSTDQGIEAELRTKYRAVKPGESVAVITDDNQTAAASDASTTAQESWWRSMLKWFGF